MNINRGYAMLAFAIVAAVLLGQQATVWQNRRSIENNRVTAEELEEVTEKNRQLIRQNRWDKAKHDEWVEELKRLNPTLKFPE